MKKAVDPFEGLVPGTQEYAAREHWEFEKAEYEKRTGEAVTFEPPLPLTQTPIESEDITPRAETLAEMTKEQLVSFALSFDIEGAAKMKKADLIAAIEAADDADYDGDEELEEV